MCKSFLILLGLVCVFQTDAQTIKFKKSTLQIKEPYDEKNLKAAESEFELIVEGKDIPAANPISVEVAVGKDSKYNGTIPLTDVILTKNINVSDGDNVINLKIGTSLSDADEFLLLKLSFKIGDEPSLVSDTIFITNVFPYAAKKPKDYRIWNDPKSIEVFIGTNFDFFDDVKVTDWYGGVRAFLPGITNLRYKKERVPKRWGIAGGIYHSKSFSNFGRNMPDSSRAVYSKVTRIYSDTVDNVAIPTADVRFDTLGVKRKLEINNWGAYINPLFEWSSSSEEDEFRTNIYVGAFIEVIRRNTSMTYEFDSAGSITQKIKYAELRSLRPVPIQSKNIFFDSYLGANMPIQFLWKDIADLRINPVFGVGMPGMLYRAEKSAPLFYLVQFDLLARIGGIKINLGGEVRGYFPKEAPIFTSYIGTSFSIDRLSGLDRSK